MMAIIGPKIVNTWATEDNPAQPPCALEEPGWPVDDGFEEAELEEEVIVVGEVVGDAEVGESDWLVDEPVRKEPESVEEEVIVVDALNGDGGEVAGVRSTCKQQSRAMVSHVETCLTYHLVRKQAQ